jgi:hypothetical protein
MARQPIDLAAVRRAEEQLARVLAQYPALRERHPEREAALADFLATLDTEEADDGEKTNGEAPRPSQDQGL